MAEPGSADEGFLLRRVMADAGQDGIEVCSVMFDADTDPACTFFPKGTSAFAVAEKLLELIERDERRDAGLTSRAQPLR